MDRCQVLQACLDFFDRPRYLEIGVNQGHTFHEVKAYEKVGVDPHFLFDVQDAKLKYPENHYVTMTSDDYFRSSFQERREKFDVIFIDGLHVFEQVLRDFLNSCELLSADGVIIVDDVIPRDFASSVPDLDVMYALRKAEGSIDATWMGDVYKVAFFISAFIPSFQYNTVMENHGQMICWREGRHILPTDLLSIINKNFGSVVLEKDIFQLLPFTQICEKISARPHFKSVVHVD